MKRLRFGLMAWYLLSFAPHGSAATLYVDLNSPGPAAPFTNWATAATNIQDAVDSSLPGDVVMVTNGVYQFGGRPASGTSLTNRLTVTTPITVQSVNGPSATVIQGYQVPGATNGNSAVRCVYLSGGATLSGFTLTNGAVFAVSSLISFFEVGGGGVYCVDTDENVVNCLITGNAAGYGAGACRGNLSNCVVSANTSVLAVSAPGFMEVLWDSGGGAAESVLWNCVLISNASPHGGGAGAFMGWLNDCLVVSNQTGGGVVAGFMNNCTIVANTGGGVVPYNLPDQWEYAPPIYYYLTNCILYSNKFNGSVTNFVGHGGYMMNCCTFPMPASSNGFANITNYPLFVDPLNGNFRLQPGSPCVNAGNNAFVTGTTDLDGHPRIADGTVDMGAYELEFRFVNVANSTPLAPYITWATAATNIQDAVDGSLAGDLILVTNGVYQTGGRPASPFSLTNRVTIASAITVQSVNGPSVTIIQGFQVPGTTNGQAAVRCVYLAGGASVSGFTLANGATFATTSRDIDPEVEGGGVFCADTNEYLSNCLITRNSAGYGAGAFMGTLSQCQIISNAAIPVDDSVFAPGPPVGGQGGGAAESVLNRCQIFGNQASNGGGAAFGWLNNCLVVSNQAAFAGAGLSGTFCNCTIAANIGGGVGPYQPPFLWQYEPPIWYYLTNCILYSNTHAGTVTNCIGQGGLLVNCCVFPLPAATNGWANFTNDPAFVDLLNGDFHLSSNSSCINSGNNACAPPGTDLDGNPRISGGMVDTGAYEFQNPASIISYAWLQQYGLPTDGSADFTDTDGNGMNNWQKWVAGLDPTNPAPVLQVMNPASSGTNIVVTWQSVTNINYFLQRSSSLTPGSFQYIASGIPGQAGTTSYVDTNAPAPGPWFYRVGVL